VRNENVELPSGRIEGSEIELPVRTLSRLDTPEDFENLILIIYFSCFDNSG
jgi:multidrug efflux pump